MPDWDQIFSDTAPEMLEGAIQLGEKLGGAGFRGVNSLLDQYQARTVHELKAVHDAGQFLPVNLIAADSTGETLYADPGPIPNLTAAQTAACSPFGTVVKIVCRQ